ncbi:MAG: hypothetical protein L0323_19560 [Planctomycetes bacterium]|nr:hypothetical protein [Planctomycetota bacterium]
MTNSRPSIPVPFEGADGACEGFLRLGEGAGVKEKRKALASAMREFAFGMARFADSLDPGPVRTPKHWDFHSIVELFEGTVQEVLTTEEKKRAWQTMEAPTPQAASRGRD